MDMISARALANAVIFDVVLVCVSDSFDVMIFGFLSYLCLRCGVEHFLYYGVQ